MIQTYKFNFQKKQLGTFDYHMMMKNQNQEIGEAEAPLVDVYYQCINSLGAKNISIQSGDDAYVESIVDMRSKLSAFGDEDYVVDVIVKQIFCVRKATHKAMFWDAYGDTAYEHLVANHAGDQAMCQKCGKRFNQMHPNQCLCKECSEAGKRVPVVYPPATCYVCGREYVPKDLKQTMCPVCQWIADNPPIPVATDRVGTCMMCGSLFDVNPRGRKAKLCKRCQDRNRSEKARVRMERFKARYR